MLAQNSALPMTVINTKILPRKIKDEGKKNGNVPQTKYKFALKLFVKVNMS